MSRFVAVFFTCSIINTTVFALDKTDDEDDPHIVQYLLIMGQSLLIFWHNMMTLKLYWRYSNPVKHRVLFEVSQSIERNRMQIK